MRKITVLFASLIMVLGAMFVASPAEAAGPWIKSRCITRDPATQPPYTVCAVATFIPQTDGDGGLKVTNVRIWVQKNCAASLNDPRWLDGFAAAQAPTGSANIDGMGLGNGHTCDESRVASLRGPNTGSMDFAAWVTMNVQAGTDVRLHFDFPLCYGNVC